MIQDFWQLTGLALRRDIPRLCVRARVFALLSIAAASTARARVTLPPRRRPDERNFESSDRRTIRAHSSRRYAVERVTFGTRARA